MGTFKNFKVLQAILFFFGILLFGSHAVFPCSCMRPKAPKDELYRATVVFTGMVLDEKVVQNELRGRELKFKVERVWKGVNEDIVFIVTGFGGGDCGYPFIKGERYLVYAYKGKNNSFYTGICSRTVLLTDAKEDLAALGAGKKLKQK